MILSEEPSREWQFDSYMDRPVNRGGSPVREHLASRGVRWEWSHPHPDLYVYKQISKLRLHPGEWGRFIEEHRQRHPRIHLIGEPREIAPWAYLHARPDQSLVISPGTRFPYRLYFPSDWADPRLETWHARKRCFLYIGRPMPHRVRMIGALKALGLPVVIHSKTPWPFPEWKGPCEDEYLTSLEYQFRVCCENTLRWGSHSDKLFLGLRAGNLTLYLADPTLRLPGVDGTYVPWSPRAAQAIFEDRDAQDRLLKRMETFLYGRGWEIYSFGAFFDRIVDLAQDVLDRPR
jgi:hypothetical protein